MKFRFIFFFTLLFSFSLFSCKEDDDEITVCDETGKVLMLAVDFTTNKFESGTILPIYTQSETFTITNEYKEPSDFGYVKLYYSELDELLFYGDIIWMGSGKMKYPESLSPANQFEAVDTKDFVFPANGFEDLFNQTNQTYDYEEIWSAVQSLSVARIFLSENPQQKVKMFLYTPSVGVGNPEEWKWIIFLKR